MPTTPRADCELTYQVFGDGTIKTKLAYVPVKELGDMPEFGVMFQINADYDQVEWYGLGPEETYADRTQGAKLGIYRNEVKDNLAKYLVPAGMRQQDRCPLRESDRQKGKRNAFCRRQYELQCAAIHTA